MIETEDQRRWWFATHPGTSSSNRDKENRHPKVPTGLRPKESTLT